MSMKTLLFCVLEGQTGKSVCIQYRNAQKVQKGQRHEDIVSHHLLRKDASNRAFSRESPLKNVCCTTENIDCLYRLTYCSNKDNYNNSNNFNLCNAF